MPELRPLKCPMSGDTHARLAFAYDAPPPGEVGFPRDVTQTYYREVWQFEESKHFVSCHSMQVATRYDGAYVNASYGDAAGMVAAFERVLALPPALSDNVGRLGRIRQCAAEHFGAGAAQRSLLDVGSGLGVFPLAVKQAGWQCTAVDPDPRAAAHIQTRVGVPTFCRDFMEMGEIGQFDIVTFNKVLEHVDNPVAMLTRAHQYLRAGGIVYVEVPDGEMAALEGGGRAEFFIEHLHIFSRDSLAMMANLAGFKPLAVERLREPSSKLTLRGFLAPA